MMEDFDVRIPSALMMAALPHWVKMVWIAVRSRQGNNESCWGGLASISERCLNNAGKPIDHSQLSKGLQRLIDEGWIERNGQQLTCLIVEPHSKNVEPHSIGMDSRSMKMDSHSIGVEPHSIPSKNQHIKPKVKPTLKKERFVRPKLEEVASYFAERGAVDDSERFFDYYESNGWKVGRNAMKDWKATVRNWIKRNREYGTGPQANNGAGRSMARGVSRHEGLPAREARRTVQALPAGKAKRDGELDRREYLERCGYSELEIAKLLGELPTETNDPAGFLSGDHEGGG